MRKEIFISNTKKMIKKEYNFLINEKCEKFYWKEEEAKKVVWKTVWKINRNEEKVKVSQIKKINLDKSEKKV